MKEKTIGEVLNEVKDFLTKNAETYDTFSIEVQIDHSYLASMDRKYTGRFDGKLVKK